MKEHATTSAPSSSPRRLSLRRAFKWLIISLALIVAADGIFQFARTEWENHRYPPRGKLVEIGGLRLHINCTGSGSPTVLMENGPNDSLVVWQLVQPDLSKFTSVCSYDRAGFGWSDAPNEPRTNANIADELNRLLTRAGIPGPYVLVPFEYGALNMRVFASRHREQVVGMVLVDPTHPDMHHRPPFNRSEEHTSELQSPCNLVCRLLLEKKKRTECLSHIIPFNVSDTRIAPSSLLLGLCMTALHYARS